MFKNLSLQGRIVSAFSVMGVLVSSVSLVGLIGTYRLNEHINTIGNNSLPSISGLWKINEGQTQIESSERALLKTNLTQEQRQLEINRIDNAWKQIREGFQQYETTPRTPLEEKTYQDFKNKWDIWEKKHQEFLLMNQNFEKIGVLRPFRQQLELTRQGKINSPEMANAIKAGEAYELMEKESQGNAQPFQAATDALLVVLKTNEEIAAKAKEASARDSSLVVFWGLVAMVVGSSASGFFAILFSKTIAKPLGERIAKVVTAANQISMGDLTAQIETSEQKDELGQLQNTFYSMNKDLNNLIRKIQESGVQITTSTTQITASGRQLEATVTEQLASTNEVSATVQQIAATSKQQVKTMEKVTTMVQNTAVLASNSQSDLSQMEGVMRQLVEATNFISTKLGVMHEKANNINSVITTITKVADQTNLLSLNAAIEAEKAGEYGAGFAVVAREIRRLADQTAVATLEIEQMVKEMQGAVSVGVMEMDKFNQSVKYSVGNVVKISEQIAEVIHQVQDLTPQFEQVSQSVEEQSEGAQQISEAMQQLSQASFQTADALRETNSALTVVDAAAQGLRTEITRFKVTA